MRQNNETTPLKSKGNGIWNVFSKGMFTNRALSFLKPQTGNL